MPTMGAAEAWAVLGKDPAAVFARLAALPRSSRAAAAEQDLAEARKLAKTMMAAHHPDRGGDPEKFRRVNDALASIEAHTADFIKRITEAEQGDGTPQKRRSVFIKFGGG